MKFNLEELERRDAPANWQTETFDSLALGVLPAGWAQWSSTTTSAYSTSNSKPYAGPNGLASNTASNVTSRTWQLASVAPDTSVSAAVFAGTLIPTEIIARGQNLASNAPTFYAASVTRGVNVQLIKSVNGTRTVLASLQSIAYVSQVWLQVSLQPVGNQLNVEVQNKATGQYLNSARQWQPTKTYAITATDTSIPAAGNIGVNRPALYAGAVNMDNFASAPPDVTPPPPPAQNPSVPAIPAHYTHIRIAQLAYAGTPMTSFEQDLLRNSVDLVIPNPMFLGPIQSIAPNTPQLIYTNTSNLYENLLTDWLTYADANVLNREAAFYHVAQATNFTGSSPSSIPVNWLWSVTTGNRDYTGSARNVTTNDVHLGGAAGTAMYFGYPDKFRELNFTIATPAANGWTGVLEYAKDANTWAPLTLVTDTTAKFTKSGQITFDPPSDWKTAAVTGTTKYFYVRLRTITAGTSPVATTVFGRDYVNAKGTNTGVIPAFDGAADSNNDGYLNDTEYASRASGKDARFRYESRVFYPNYGQMRFATNPTSAGMKNWAADWHKRMIASNPLADGFFVDNSNGRSPLGNVATIESTTTYSAEYAQMLKAVSTAIAPRWLLANTSGGNASTDAVVQVVPASFEEFSLRPMSATWSRFNDIAALVTARMKSANSPYLILDSHPQGGSVTDPRTQMGTLAYYYLLADPVRTFLMFFGGNEPNTSWTRHWTPAAAFDVGQPTAAWTEWATGSDPANTGLTYKVLGRNYSKSLVLYKPLSYKLGVGTGTTADNTVTTHTLSRNYRALRHDGTLGPVVTSISLRNGEGAILIPA